MVSDPDHTRSFEPANRDPSSELSEMPDDEMADLEADVRPLADTVTSRKGKKSRKASGSKKIISIPENGKEKTAGKSQ